MVQTPEQAQALAGGAIGSTRARLSRLPPAITDSEKLARMADLEQAPRQVLSDLDLSALSEADKRTMWAGIWAQIGLIDRENQASLLQMVLEEKPRSTHWHRS